MARTLLFLSTTLAVLVGAEALALVLFSYSLIRYTGFEVVIIGILLDGYSGAFYAIPYLSITTFALWILTDTLKQVLLLYTNKNEVIS